MYKRPWYVRLSRRHGSAIITVITSTAAALLFSGMFVAVLLTLGNTDNPAPVDGGSDVCISSFAFTETIPDGDPRPLIVASGAGLDLQEVER